MDQDKSVTESLYKQNLEIAQKNRTLSLLSKLYEISLENLDTKTLAEQITKIIQTDLDLELVSIRIYNRYDNSLNPLAIHVSDRVKNAEIKNSFYFYDQIIRGVEQSNFFDKILTDKKMNITNDLGVIFNSSEPKIKQIQDEGHIRSIIVNPLATQKDLIGVLIISLNQSYQGMAQNEKDSIDSLINVVAVALEKAMIYQELEESNHRQEGLIHFISHEIKGFLTKNLAVFAGIKEGDYGLITPELLETSSYALVDTKKGVETVMDILNASNLKKGTTSFHFDTFNLDESLKNIIESEKPEAAKKGVLINLSVDTSKNYELNGDKDQLEKHVFRNLIDNAIKYTPTGFIDIKLVKENNKILFSVKDSGIGLTEDDKKRLFTEGGRGKDSTLVNVNSTGYGLFIAKQIVSVHKGRIWAESEGKDKGSTFFVEL